MYHKLLIRGVDYQVSVQGMGPPVMLLHGFTGSSQNWFPLLPQLTADHQVIAPDLLGHGRTGAPDYAARYAMEEASADLHDLLYQLEIEQIDLVGYSMGGRLALHFACTYPMMIRTLTLESASPGLATVAERIERKKRDDKLAERIEREGIERFVDFWEGLGLWQSQKQLSAEVRGRLRQQRLENRPAGLANSLRGMGTGVQPNLWLRLEALTMPVHLLTGEYDQKFANIARQMSQQISLVEHHIISGAGHTVHLERPERWGEAVLAGIR